jgi:hypothetical protein
MMMLILLVAWFLTAAIPMIVLGYRDHPRWSSPYCVKCRYDLRGKDPEQAKDCPECGADLTPRTAVGFVRHGRRRGLVAYGFFLLLLPFLASVGLAVLQYVHSGSNPNPGNLAAQSNTAVIQFANQRPDEP